MKKIFSVLLTALFIVTASFPVLAAQDDVKEKGSSVRYMENGVTVVRTIEQAEGVGRANTGTSVTEKYYYRNQMVGQVTLTALFSYDGITAHATAASSSHWVASGWSYSGESVYTSGATAYLSATISGSTTIPVDITLTCDPYGNIY